MCGEGMKEESRPKPKQTPGVNRAARTLLAVGILVAGLGYPGLAQASSGYSYDRGLRWWTVNSLELASWDETYTEEKAIPKPVEVRCYDDGRAFERSLILRGDSLTSIRTTVAYYRGGNTIHMRTLTCSQ